MNNYTFGFNYDCITWEKNGLPLFFGGKLNFTKDDKAVLRYLLRQNKIPSSYFPNVSFCLFLIFYSCGLL